MGVSSNVPFHFRTRHGGKTWLIVLALLAIWTLMLTIAAQAASTGRYTLTPVDDGFLRLDTETGIVSLCQKADGRWRCQTVEDDLLALRQENEKLRAQNKALREGQTAPQALPPGQQPFKLPSKEEIDKAFDFLNEVLRKFREMIESQTPYDNGAEL